MKSEVLHNCAQVCKNLAALAIVRFHMHMFKSSLATHVCNRLNDFMLFLFACLSHQMPTITTTTTTTRSTHTHCTCLFFVRKPYYFLYTWKLSSRSNLEMYIWDSETFCFNDFFVASFPNRLPFFSCLCMRVEVVESMKWVHSFQF